MGCGASSVNKVAHKLVTVAPCENLITGSSAVISAKETKNNKNNSVNKGTASTYMDVNQTAGNEATTELDTGKMKDVIPEKGLLDTRIENASDDKKSDNNSSPKVMSEEGSTDNDKNSDDHAEDAKSNKSGGTEKQKETLEERLAGIEERVTLFLNCDLEIFNTSEPLGKMRYLSNRTKSSLAPKSVLIQRKKIMECGFVKFVFNFLKWSYDENNGEFFFAGNADAKTNMKAVLGVMWNSTDRGVECCQMTTDAGLLELMIRILQDERFKNELDTDYMRYVFKAFMAVFHNVSQNFPESSEVFRKANIVEVLSRYLDTTFLALKSKILFVLSYLTTEAENDILNASDANIRFMVGLLKETLANKNHYNVKSGYRTSELLHALNKLASNDANKEKLVEGGILPICVQLLRPENSEEEQVLAGKCIWTLAFNEENKRKIRDEPGLMEVLERTSGSPIDRISQAARGAIWVIEDKLGEKAELKPSQTDAAHSSDSFDESVPHVMISYNWGSKPTMLKVRDFLRERGYKVWMDVDHMTGSTLEAMAHAVEQAAVILICMSQQYKDSPSCRTEAEYAYRLRKDVVPLRLQPHYLPDGWLGIMMGTKLWFDVSTDGFISENLPRIAKEIGQRGRVGGAVTGATSGAVTASPERPVKLNVEEVQTSPKPSTSSDNKVPLSSPHSMFPEAVPQNTSVKMMAPEPQNAALKPWQHRHWTEEHIKRWLEENELKHIGQRFAGFNGKLLGQLFKMSVTAPDFFYKMLKEELNLGLLDILKVMEGLDQLTLNHK